MTGVCSQRSWNFFQGDIDDAKIRAQIDAMLVKRPVAGKQPMSLLDLGYNHVRSSKRSLPRRAAAAGVAAR